MRSLLAAVAITAGLLSAAPAFAQASAEDLVRATAAKIFEEPAPASTEAEFLLQSVDVPAVTRFALGRHARSIAPADYARFEAAARGYLFRTLEAQLRTYGDARVELRETITRKPNDVIVRTRLTPKRGEALDLSWRLIDRGAGWKVVDLEVFGLWLAIETRAQFQALLEQPGANVDTLIARLETLNFQPQQRADNSRG